MAGVYREYGVQIKVRKARKRHTCRWCKKPIEPGEEYVEYRAVEYHVKGYGKNYVCDRYHKECFDKWRKWVAGIIHEELR